MGSRQQVGQCWKQGSQCKACCSQLVAGVRCVGTSWVLQADWPPWHSVLSLVRDSLSCDDLFPQSIPADFHHHHASRATPLYR